VLPQIAHGAKISARNLYKAGRCSYLIFQNSISAKQTVTKERSFIFVFSILFENTELSCSFIMQKNNFMGCLQEHTLLYDADCPMCRIYTGAFVKHGWLDKQGRQPFQQMPEDWNAVIDEQRAQSEIALINRTTRKVSYGLDALFLIIANKLPGLTPLFAARWFRWVMQRIYFFISYNRKVIAAVTPVQGMLRECVPAYSFKYRMAYLAFACLFTTVILNGYSTLMTGIVPAGTIYREFLVCGGQMIFQGIAIQFINKEKRMDYLGNMMTVSVIGALLLLPVFLLRGLFPMIPATGFVAYFLLVAGFMLIEHMRRVKLLGLGLLLSISWIVYRLIVLAIVSIPQL